MGSAQSVSKKSIKKSGSKSEKEVNIKFAKDQKQYDDKCIDFDKKGEMSPGSTIGTANSLPEENKFKNNFDDNDDDYRLVNTLRIKQIIEEFQERGDQDVVSRNKKELYRKSAYCI